MKCTEKRLSEVEDTIQDRWSIGVTRALVINVIAIEATGRGKTNTSSHAHPSRIQQSINMAEGERRAIDTRSRDQLEYGQFCDAIFSHGFWLVCLLISAVVPPFYPITCTSLVNRDPN
jgi:hypothetical protein